MEAATAAARLEAIAEQLAGPWARDEERLLDTGSVPVAVRKRARRFYLDDRGAAVARARALGARGDWLPVAERVVDEHWLNVNRRGVISVIAVEGRDVASLVLRLADCAEAVQAALLDELA